MLPRATHTRGNREAAKGKQSGRTQEIQRLIGRSLRAVVDLKALGERQITVDCDVIQADGGTRTASISGGWVALRIAIDKLLASKALAADPIRTQVAGVSCGIHQGTAVRDLDYEEDSQAGCDGNFVLTADGSIVEAQVTAEGECYDEEGLLRLLRLARIGCSELFAEKLKATGRSGRSATGWSLTPTIKASCARFRRWSSLLVSPASAPRSFGSPSPSISASASPTMPTSRRASPPT